MHWQRPGGFKSVFQLQPKGLELLIWGGWDETLPTLLAPLPASTLCSLCCSPEAGTGTWHSLARWREVVGGEPQQDVPAPRPEPPVVPRRGAQVPAWCPCPAPRVTPLLFTSNC